MNILAAENALSEGKGVSYTRLCDQIEAVGRRTVARYAKVSYQTVCNFIWGITYSKSTHYRLTQAVVLAYRAKLSDQMQAVRSEIEQFQKLTDGLIEELEADFVELQKNFVELTKKIADPDPETAIYADKSL